MLKCAQTGLWQGFKSTSYSWHGSKTALFIATGPRFLFLMTSKETYGAGRKNSTACVPHECHITHSATLSASTNPDRRLTDLALKDTKITERHFDPAKERMLEQVLLLSGGYHKRSIMYQFSLHCVDGTTELDIASAPTRERPEHSENKKMSSLRVADLVTDDSVRSSIDDRRNSCCRSEAGQRQAREILGPHPARLRRKKRRPPTKKG